MAWDTSLAVRTLTAAERGTFATQWASTRTPGGTTLGKAIVSADHQIDILTHKLWTVQNRMLEHRHAEKIGA